jgi:stress-induced morphogen
MVRNEINESIKEIKRNIIKYFDKINENLLLLIVEPSGICDNLHVIIISDYFNNKEQVERDEGIFNFLQENLKSEVFVQISLFLTLTNEEYNKYQYELPNVSDAFNKASLHY